MYIIIAAIQIKEGFKDRYINGIIENASSAGDGANGEVGREAVLGPEIVIAMAVDTGVGCAADLPAYADSAIAGLGESPHRFVDGLTLLVGEDQLAFDGDRLHRRTTFIGEVLLPPFW